MGRPQTLPVALLTGVPSRLGDMPATGRRGSVAGMLERAIAVSAAALLTACSGGGTSDPTPTDGKEGTATPGSGSDGTSTPDETTPPSGKTPPTSAALSVLEQGVGPVLIGRSISARRQVYVFNADRTGCYFKLLETGKRLDEIAFSNWKIDETNGKEDTNTQGTLYPVVFDTQGGFHSEADLYNTATRHVWPSGLSDLRLVKSETTYRCGE